jgi:two-component system LytT family response regulator
VHSPFRQTILKRSRLSYCQTNNSVCICAMTPDPATATPGQTTGAPVRAIIADDERLARKKLRILLDSEPEVQVVAECEDGRQTVSAIHAHLPDLLLLDIQMPDLDGFQVLGEISPAQMPVVIFTSAYDQYAIRAFEAHALDYLLKPFDQERLHHAIERARSELRKSGDREITHRILDLLSRVRSEVPSGSEPDGRLVIKAKGRVIFLNLDEIDWVEAAANYVRLNVGKESYLFREAISRTSERLNPNHFIRIHRSTIVNVRKIKELIPVNSGEYIVVLKTGKELSCSRGYRAALQRVIDKNS